jgi:hypothetical protein
MELVAFCEACGTPLHEGDDFEYCPEGIVWICRACVDAEEDRLREEFGWIGVWRSGVTGEGIKNTSNAGEPGP